MNKKKINLKRKIKNENLKNFFRFSKKAQAFESYRLLIAFVLALAFLVVIYSMIQTLNQKTILISEQKFKEGIISATKAVGISTKKEFIIEDLVLSGIISNRMLENYSGINRDCFLLVPGPGFKETEASKILNIKGNFKKMDIYTYCDFESNTVSSINNYKIEIYNSDPDCPVYCIIFFNKKPNIDYVED
jgi:hypothetical protein